MPQNLTLLYTLNVKCLSGCAERNVPLGLFINPLNDELNPIRHLLALVGARHIVHISRITVKPLNAELNPIHHLIALVGAHHIVHVSGIRVNHVIIAPVLPQENPTTSRHPI